MNNLHLAIIRQNGSGKTSLINIMNGYHQLYEGKAFVLGTKFCSADLQEPGLDIEIQKMCYSYGEAL
jgi:ABC-type molybdenum transport system ATPase subunit/photorepair protein PhrA